MKPSRALLALLAAFVGTSNNKRRRVAVGGRSGRKSPSIDDDEVEEMKRTMEYQMMDVLPQVAVMR